jgi:antitoxin ParD1/3/4
MNAYKRYLTIEDPNHIVLSGLPFKPGQRVEVIILAEDKEKEALASKLQQLFKETQASHQDNPLTDDEIAAEIEAYRRGE